MVDVTNFAQMLLPFVLLVQGICFLINGIAEEKKCTQNKEKEVEKKKEKISLRSNHRRMKKKNHRMN